MADNPSTQLAGIKLLAHLSSEVLESIAQGCRWRRYKRNENILGRDSESRDVFLVVKGSVEAANYSSTGREIALATIRAGEYFGELSAIDDRPRSATVSAGEDCLIAIMPRVKFLDLLRNDSTIAMAVMNRLASIIRTCDDRIMDLSTLGAVQRVYVELLRLCGPDPAVSHLWSVYPMPTQADIAARASTTRETVARVLSQLTQDGLIQRKGRTLYLNDRERLKQLAEHLDSQKAPAR